MKKPLGELRSRQRKRIKTKAIVAYQEGKVK